MRCMLSLLIAPLLCFVGGCSQDQARPHLPPDSAQATSVADPSQLLIQARAALERRDYTEAARLAKAARAHKNDETQGQIADSIIQISSSREQALADSAEQARQSELSRRKHDSDLEAQRRRRILAGLWHKRDEVEHLDWYYDQASSQFVNSSSRIVLYIGMRDRGPPFLRYAVRYTASDWLFIHDYTFSLDGQTQRFAPAQEIERDNDSRIWEWVDGDADESIQQLVRSIVGARRAVLRYNGRQYYRDRVIGESEKAGLRRVLNAYHGVVDTVAGRR
jgi:hypothetical protein